MATYNEYYFTDTVNERVLRYDFGTDSYSPNLAKQTDFDYFTDDFEAGDALYFGTFVHGGGSIRGIKLYVGTALSATAVVFVWEYWNGSWTELPNLVNGDAMTKLGEQTVFWGIIGDWERTLVAGGTGQWVRCRIASVSNPIEGGAQSTQRIMFGNNTLTITGGTAESPLTMEDVYNEAETIESGLIVKAGHLSKPVHICYCYLKLDGYFQFLKNIIYFMQMYNPTNATGWLKLGRELDEELLMGTDGCYLYVTAGGADLAWRWSGKMHVYNSIIECPNRIYSPNFELMASQFNVKEICGGELLSFRNTDNPFEIHVEPKTMVFDEARLNKYIAWKNRTSTLVNTWVRTLCLYYGHTLTTKNCVVKKFVEVRTAGATDATWTEQFTLNLKVTDRKGNPLKEALVKCWDKQGNEVFSTVTNAEGKITEQTLTRRVYTMIYPSGSSEVFYTPHVLKISKPGFLDYEMQFTIASASDWVIALPYSWEWTVLAPFDLETEVALPEIEIAVEKLSIELEVEEVKVTGELVEESGNKN